MANGMLSSESSDEINSIPPKLTSSAAAGTYLNKIDLKSNLIIKEVNKERCELNKILEKANEIQIANNQQ